MWGCFTVHSCYFDVVGCGVMLMMIMMTTAMMMVYDAVVAWVAWAAELIG